MRFIRALAPALAFLTLQAFASSAYACEPGEDVLAAIRCLPGVTAEEVTSTVSGYRQFEIQFQQPTDHTRPEGATFNQRLVLLHRGFNEPLVLQTSGYSIFSVAQSGLARAFAANQIQVEHRFFSSSVPADRDWSKLDIVQSAADFHAITVAFKQLYQHRWVGTGASKGGMTSVYHRRFYPNDLDGTVADVAPLSFSQDDPRYIGFVDRAGGDLYAACRAKLAALQIALLEHRADILPNVEGSFEALGGKSVGFEHAVIELPFAFWQYQNPTSATVGCNRVPAANASLTSQLAFLETVNAVSGYGDESFAGFAAYYYQAGSQLGAPGAKLEHLGTLRQHDYSIDQYMPHEVPYTYSNEAMQDVERWVLNDAASMMFVYGEFDPWTAGAFPSVEGRDMHWYLVPGGNHSSKVFLLPAEQKRAALRTLAVWFDKEPVNLELESNEPTLDELELNYRKLNRLP